jgi:hypothetical protein
MNIGQLARDGVSPSEMRSALFEVFECVELDVTHSGFCFVCQSDGEVRLMLDYEYTAKGKWRYEVKSIRSWRGNEIALKTV